MKNGVKRAVAAAVAACLLLTALPAATISADDQPPAIRSTAACMLDRETGRIVYEKQAEQQGYPASLTKIAAVLVCLEQRPDWQQGMVTAPEGLPDEFADPETALVDIRPGEQLPLRDVLYAAMLPSACDAASLLAYAVDGTDRAAFVQKMNELAVRAGATATHFSNPHGLPDEQNVSTAYDLACLTRYAMQNAAFAQIAGTAQYVMSATNIHPQPRVIENSNRMLLPGDAYYLAGTLGVKTGTLELAGGCLSTVCQNNEARYVLVTLDAPLDSGDDTEARYEDQHALYAWAFASLRNRPLLSTTQTAALAPVAQAKGTETVELVPAESVTLRTTDTYVHTLQRVVELQEALTAPLNAGDAVGQIRLCDPQTGETVASTALLVKTTVTRKLSWWEQIAAFFGTAIKTVGSWFG